MFNKLVETIRPAFRDGYISTYMLLIALVMCYVFIFYALFFVPLEDNEDMSLKKNIYLVEVYNPLVPQRDIVGLFTSKSEALSSIKKSIADNNILTVDNYRLLGFQDGEYYPGDGEILNIHKEFENES